LNLNRFEFEFLKEIPLEKWPKAIVARQVMAQLAGPGLWRPKPAGVRPVRALRCDAWCSGLIDVENPLRPKGKWTRSLNLRVATHGSSGTHWDTRVLYPGITAMWGARSV
jgi:hypothetical protein